MPSAADDVRAAIGARHGSIPFDEFIQVALYGAHGFYTSTDPGRAGRRGDFLTSPEVGPLFGQVLARAIDDRWRTLGEPEGFTVVDAGAGPGTLARSILAARPEFLRNGRYIAVETSASQRSLHPQGVESAADMPGHIDAGVVVANELLDNLPFELWVHDDRWRPANVSVSGDGFVEVLGSDTPPSILPLHARHGSRAPIQRDAVRWLDATLQSVDRGTVWVIDYCTPLTAEVAGMPWREWLRTYAGHERGVHYLKNVGQQDITTQVCVDQLAQVRAPDAVRSQSQFLQRWGIDELVEEGRKVWTESASSPTVAALKMRSRISEAEALLDPNGLGSFTVLEWTT